MTYESLRCEKSKPAFLRLAGGCYEFNSCLDVEKFKDKIAGAANRKSIIMEQLLQDL